MNKYRTLYKALPFCIEDKENQGILEKENIYKTYTYKSNFAKIVLSDDNEEFFNAKEKQIINLLYDEECKSLYLTNQNSEIQATFNPMSSTIYIDTQTKELYLFANDKDFIDCDTIYEQIKQELKLQESIEELQSYKPSLFFYSTLLLGSSEIQSNPFLFGTPDTKSNIGLDESKPIYHFSPKDEENNLGTLTIFLNSCTLTLLNYPLLDSSLNIKLECNSSESKAIQEREQTQREQTQKESTPIDSLTSTAMLHPILEDNEIKCPHNGVVKLKSNKGKPFTSKGIPMVLESDLLNSQILGCTNPLLSGGPCTMVATILPNARGLKKFNDDYPIMQDLVSSGVMSDKGFPLICTPKENTFRINSPNPSNANTQSKEALSSQIDIAIPSLTLITPYRDLEEYYFTPSTYENRESKEQYISSQSGFYTPNDTLEIILPPLSKNTDYARLDSNTPLAPLLQELSDTYTPTFFSYRILSLRVAYSIYEYLLLIPKTMPRFITQLLKDKRDKEELGYGYGRFIDLGRDYADCADMSHTSLKYALYFILGILVIVSFNGCSFSFKLIDPQYYKFKRLCKNVDSEVTIYNQDYWEMYSDYVEKRFKNSKIDEEGIEYFYYEKLNMKVYPYNIREILKTEQKNGNITIQTFDEYYKNIHYASYTRYNYNGKSLKLRGDEAAGWHWETEDNHTCSYLDNFYKERGR